MKQFFKNLFVHWKTSLIGVIFGILTLMLWLQKITVTEWIEAAGSLGVIIGVFAKDWDKTTE